MNREIKFRAKEALTDQWVYFDLINEGLWGVPVGKMVIINTLTQYTGLKDKNGKEIYEGDIVKTWIFVDKKPEPETNKASIYFEDGSFKTSCDDMPIDCYLTLEIVGNIYENPELK